MTCSQLPCIVGSFFAAAQGGGASHNGVRMLALVMWMMDVECVARLGALSTDLARYSAAVGRSLLRRSVRTHPVFVK